MSKVILAAVVILAAGAGTAAAGDWGRGRYHLDYRDYQRYDYRDAYRFPMNCRHLDYDAFHNQARYRDFTRTYAPNYGPYGYRYYQGPSGLTLSGPRYYLNFRH